MLRVIRTSTASPACVLLSRAAPGALPVTARISTSAGWILASRVVVGSARSGTGALGGAKTAMTKRSQNVAVRLYHGRSLSSSSLQSSSSSPRLVAVLSAPVVAALCAGPTLPRRAVESLARSRGRRLAAARCESRPRTSRRGRDSREDDDDERGSRTSSSVRSRLIRAVRAWLRALQLLLTLGPAAALYPVGRLLSTGSDADGGGSRQLPGWYLDICLRLAESSGAAVVKLLQWASSRPDLFGEPFCAVFERLQDRTTPHGLEHTERALREAYGEKWEDRIRLGEVLGSGCIGQVYKGTIDDKDGMEKEVAIKGMPFLLIRFSCC